MRQYGKAFAVTFLAATAALAVQPGAAAEQRQVPDTYTMLTTHMTPADVGLKADIIRWSTDQERAAVVAALTGADDPVAALRELPTVGVVWRDGSAVGHSVKYAHRETRADGTETITLVTDKRIGSTSFAPWTAETPAQETPLGYSVVEMTTGEPGMGTMSLAAKIVIDAAAGTVGLDHSSGTPVLTDVKLQPKPYWAAHN